jgi:hypothetical protein
LSQFDALRANARLVRRTNRVLTMLPGESVHFAASELVGSDEVYRMACPLVRCAGRDYINHIEQETADRWIMGAMLEQALHAYFTDKGYQPSGLPVDPLQECRDALVAKALFVERCFRGTVE